MKVKYRIFNILCLGPQKIKDLISLTNTSKNTMYSSLESLMKEGLIKKDRVGKEVRVSLNNDFRSQKMKDLFLKARRVDIDPSRLLNKSFIDVFKAIEENEDVDIKAIIEYTGRPYRTVYAILTELLEFDMIEKKRERPLVVNLRDSTVNDSYKEFIAVDEISKPIFTIEDRYMKRVYTTPIEIERSTFSLLGTPVSSTATEATGPIYLGEGTPVIYHPVKEDDTPETIFMSELMRSEGVEDICIRMIKDGSVRFSELIRIARTKGILNVLGCYLDVLHSIEKDLVPSSIITRIRKDIIRKPEKRITFLRSEVKFEKTGWETKFERRWNIDLYLDIGAIRHTVRGL